LGTQNKDIGTALQTLNPAGGGGKRVIYTVGVY